MRAVNGNATGSAASAVAKPAESNSRGPRRLVELNLTVRKSVPVTVIVRSGLEPNSAHAVFVKRLGAKYSRVVEVSTDAAGEVQLPVIEFRSRGMYVMALREGDATEYLKVRVRS